MLDYLAGLGVSDIEDLLSEIERPRRYHLTRSQAFEALGSILANAPEDDFTARGTTRDIQCTKVCIRLVDLLRSKPRSLRWNGPYYSPAFSCLPSQYFRDIELETQCFLLYAKELGVSPLVIFAQAKTDSPQIVSEIISGAVFTTYALVARTDVTFSDQQTRLAVRAEAAPTIRPCQPTLVASPDVINSDHYEGTIKVCERLGVDAQTAHNLYVKEWSEFLLQGAERAFSIGKFCRLFDIAVAALRDLGVDPAKALRELPENVCDAFLRRTKHGPLNVTSEEALACVDHILAKQGWKECDRKTAAIAVVANLEGNKICRLANQARYDLLGARRRAMAELHEDLSRAGIGLICKPQQGPA